MLAQGAERSEQHLPSEDPVFSSHHAQLESLGLPSTAWLIQEALGLAVGMTWKEELFCCLWVTLISLVKCLSHLLMPLFCITTWAGSSHAIWVHSDQACPSYSTTSSYSSPLLPPLVPLHLRENSFLGLLGLAKAEKKAD